MKNTNKGHNMKSKVNKLIAILNQLGTTTEQNNLSLVAKAVDIINGLIGPCEKQCMNDLKVFKPSWLESLAKYLEGYLKDPKNKTKFYGKTELQKVVELVKAGILWIKSYCEECFNKLSTAVNLQPSMAKKMDRWYEDPNFYAAENMSPDAIIENVSTIIRGSKCLQKCLASQTFAGMGTWEETLRDMVWNRWVLLEEDHDSERNDPMIGSVVHMQVLELLKAICPNCFG
jgi:hypothetical protein